MKPRPSARQDTLLNTEISVGADFNDTGRYAGASISSEVVLAGDASHRGVRVRCSLYMENQLLAVTQIT